MHIPTILSLAALSLSCLSLAAPIDNRALDRSTFDATTTPILRHDVGKRADDLKLLNMIRTAQGAPNLGVLELALASLMEHGELLDGIGEVSSTCSWCGVRRVVADGGVGPDAIT